MGSQILIIDESQHYVELITIRLKNYGYETVLTTRSGAQGMELVDKEHSDLVLIDTRISDMDGFKLCRQIKSKHGNDVKVILMTGLAERYNPSMAMQVAADDYVVKTFDCLLLMVSIKKLLAKIEQAEEAKK